MRAVRRAVGMMWLGLGACPSPVTSGESDAATSSSSTETGAPAETSGSSSSGGTTAAATTPEPAPDAGIASRCGSDSPEALMDCVDPARWAEDVAFMAQSRPPGSIHWQKVQDRCAAALEQAGFAVQRQDYGTGINVIGTREGAAAASEVVLLAAHYDHVSGCPGADDNASGVAGALEVARVLGQARLPRTLMVACWDEEELGLRGSRAFAQTFTGAKLAVAFNFDMIGYASAAEHSQIFPGPLAERFPGLADELTANKGRADFIAVVADASAEPFALELERRAERLGRLTGVMTLTDAEKLDDDAFGVLSMSDHRSFWERGLPALHVFDTGVFRNPAYHCTGGLDTSDTLDHAFATDVLKATTAAVAAAAGL
ncbi:M20/M25/M40 family metallo-hydrolase [Nannocystis pusilla]|uniref:M20/M25/M40 family metallo-hydrolase n=1 Tax=Nannocystis pusilla TaxID=889268 RepID=A0A9X3EJL5_9BACT|nr:M20/M25/M40 family metallo-hydrolase [Nannocystis pusilla]MCY1005314.1 M20/M25/M40 family metallo-hydrolase [Nannocystis pusilla]